MDLLPGNVQALGRRTEQQDAFALSDLGDADFRRHGGALCVVCDGMGGHAAGGDAARAAVAAFLAHYTARPSDEPIETTLQQALQQANAAVLAVAEAAGGSGSTLVAAVLHEGLLRWISVGDSRLLLLRDRRLHRVNHEHRYRSELLREAADGAMPFEQARSDPRGELLTSSLGEADAPPMVDRSWRPLPLRVHDQVYLVTDGIYRTLDDDALLGATLDPTGRPAPPEQVCAAWAARAIALDLPEQDNLTAAGLAWEPGAEARDGSRAGAPAIGFPVAASDTAPAPPPARPWPMGTRLAVAAVVTAGGLGGLMHVSRGPATLPGDRALQPLPSAVPAALATASVPATASVAAVVPTKPAPAAPAAVIAPVATAPRTASTPSTGVARGTAPAPTRTPR